MFRILYGPSSGSVERAWLKLLVIFFCVRSRCLAAAKHRLRTQKNITSNFSQARSTLPEDGP